MLMHIRPLNNCRAAGKEDMRSSSIWCLNPCKKILLGTLPEWLGPCQFDPCIRNSLSKASSIPCFYHFTNFLYSQIFILFMSMQIPIGCFLSCLMHHGIEHPISKSRMSAKWSTLRLHQFDAPYFH